MSSDPSEILPHVARGPEGRPPIVFLHGFAGDHETWIGQLIGLETRRRVIAFDLPGHGAALDWPRVGHAGIAAEAVIGSLGKGAIEFIPFPEHLKGRYQSFTEADLSRLRGAGYNGSFRDVATGVREYMEWLKASS